jgi:hypothetical protein
VRTLLVQAGNNPRSRKRISIRTPLDGHVEPAGSGSGHQVAPRQLQSRKLRCTQARELIGSVPVLGGVPDRTEHFSRCSYREFET